MGGVMVACLGYSFKELPGGIMHLWFLVMLFFVSIIFHLSRKLWQGVNGYKQIALLLLLFLLQLGLIPLQDLTTNQTILKLYKNVTDWLPVYYMGIVISENSIFEILERRSCSWLCCLLLASLLYIAFRLIGSNAEYLPIPHCVLFISIYLLLMRTGMQTSWNKMKTAPFFDHLAKYSLGIYIIHHLLIYDPLKHFEVCRQVIDSLGALAPFMIFLIVMPLSYGIVASICKSKFSEYIIGIK